MVERRHPRGSIVATDTLRNLVSGLGGRLDKSIYTRWTMLGPLGKDQLDSAFRGDWVARKAITIPAEDATREWREWQADKDQVDAIEKVEKELGIQAKLKDAFIKARLYGGGGLVIGTGDEDPSQPLDPSTVKKDGLRYVVSFSRWDIQAGTIDRDVLSPTYGMPENYTISKSAGGITDIHPSRIVRLVGVPLPDSELSTDGWGDSLLQSIDDAVKNVGRVSQGLAILVDEAKTDVVKIPNLMANMATTEYRERLISRFELAMAAKSIINTTLLDKEEEWDRITTQFSTTDKILQLYLLIASGAADIPATRMLGQSAVGLNATGDNDIRNYYDMIASIQSNVLTPAMAILDEVLVRSAVGTYDDGFTYDWRSLWQMTEKEAAEVGKLEAETYAIDALHGAVPPEALDIGRQNQLIERGVYPGLRQAIDEVELFGPETEEEPTEPEPDPEESQQAELEAEEPAQQTTDQWRKARAKALGITLDAVPRTLYVSRPVVNARTILTWAKKQGFVELEKPSQLHVTIAYSIKEVDWLEMGEPFGQDEEGQYTIRPGGPRMVEQLGPKGATVLMFASNELAWRHQDMLHRGAEWQWDEYMPHITLTYAEQSVDLDEVEPYQGKIVLGPEKFETIKEAASNA